MAQHIFTGFGFGPIQGGLFVKEAFQSGNFNRIVVSEIDQEFIDAVMANKGSYYVNVAGAGGIEVLKIDNIEMLNPGVAENRQKLVEVLAESTEITICLPSVVFYDSGRAHSVTSLIADGLRNNRAPATIIHTAENHNQAAEINEYGVLNNDVRKYCCV